MSKGIRQFFREHAAQRTERRIFDSRLAVLTNAILKDDHSTFARFFPDVKQSHLYNEHVAKKLLKTAITNDNAKAFTAVLDTCKNPNVWFTRSVIAGASATIASYEHVLGMALRSGSAKIALVLAKNEKVSVERSGFTEKKFAIPFNEAAVEPFKAPIELAREKGMHDVEKALKKRAALQYYAQLKAVKKAPPAPSEI